MLSSLKKWVQDVAVDLTPPPPPSSSIPGSTHHYFYSTTPVNELPESRKSSASAVYLSRPISLDSMTSMKTNRLSNPPPLVSPVEVDLSHLNREEQEHIANVLKRARAVEEQQQQSNLPSVSVPARLSPSTSISSSLTSSSSSTSTSSFVSEHLEKDNNEITNEISRNFASHLESTFSTIQQCQTSPPIYLDNESIDRDEQCISINNHQDENIMTTDQEKVIECEQEDRSIISDISRANNLTEIDENDFFYEEPSPYETAIIDEQPIPSYKIDEFVDDDDDDQDERDHVKELEETIANLTRHFPLEDQPNDSSPIDKIDGDSIFEMEIESPSADEFSYHPSIPPPPPPPVNNHRGSLSRSSGVKQNLTDLLIPATAKFHPPLQRTQSSHSKRMLLINRHKRNLPSIPTGDTLSNRLQLRRANSESRFCLPAVPLISLQNLDDENDLLEIDLNDPAGSMNRTLRSKTESELETLQDNAIVTTNTTTTNNNNQVKVKQIRDQTTNTPPSFDLNASIKSKKKLKKKNSTNTPAIAKLQKSTSTEITYPFPITKLILNPSRHDLGFQITGGHSNSNCTEVIACIVDIDKKHRNYQILQNVVQEGDEVVELGGVSLRGKSAVFVENLMNTIQNEFEIIVRNQFSFVPMDNNNIQRRHSVDTSASPIVNNIMIKPKSKSIDSIEQIDKIAEEEEDKTSKTKALTTNEESINASSARQRTSLLPNDPGINGAGSNVSIDRQYSNESDESDSLSQYFHSSQSRNSSLKKTSAPHGRSQSVIPIANYLANPASRLQNLLKSDPKRPARNSTSTERKPSLSFASLKFLKKKTKSVDFSHQKNVIINQLRANDYVGDIELQIGHDSEREQLVIRIIQARNLLPKDTNGYSDPFVKIYLLPGRDQENKRRIKYVSKTLNPVWDQTIIYAHMHREEVQYKKLEITVWDYDRFKANDFLGQVTVDLKNPNVIDDKPHWYRLQALRAREEITNRGSSPRLFKMASVDSSASLAVNKNAVNMQPRANQPK